MDAPGQSPLPRHRRIGGFSLIELAAVVLVVALLFGLVLPNFSVTKRRALDGSGERLRASLEFARQRSIATGTQHRVALDLDESRYWLEVYEKPEPRAPGEKDEADGREDAIALLAPPPVAGEFVPVIGRFGRGDRLERDQHFRTVETAEGVQERGTVAVAFAEDGSATGTVIALANDDGDALELEVLPLSDAVRIRAPQ